MRPHCLLFCALAWFVCGRAGAQYFQRLGNGLAYPQGWGIYSDSTGVYFLGGSPGEINGVISPGVIRWDGSQFHQVGCGFEWDCIAPVIGGLGNPVRTMTRWDSELYAGGDFYMSNGVVLNYIARFNGTNWQSLGSGMDGPVHGLKAYEDGLYAAGWFTHADTVPANGLARWDGTRWYSVHDLPMMQLPYDSLNFIYDVAKYDGDIYVCGNFRSEPNTNRHCIAHFNGSEWVGIGNGFRGSLTKVLHLDVHDSLLYISGAFADTGQYGNALNPASGIVGWNGSNWVELGEGTDGAYLPWVTWVTWHNDTLYACGDYDRIGGIPAGGLAKWDGTRWCSMLPAPPSYAINSMAFFQDTLFVGGSILTLGVDTLYNTGKWVYGDHVEGCGFGVGLVDDGPFTEGPPLVVCPNPAHDLVSFRSHGELVDVGVAVLYDAIGRVPRTVKIVNGQCPLSGLASGCFSVHLFSATGNTLGRVRLLVE